jgi:acyl dehydratase
VERYLEDYVVGQTYGSGRIRVDEARIKTSAAEFDPQSFHTDHESASRTIFMGLAASGWHTAAMTMRLMVDGDLKPAGGIVGTGFEEFRWPRSLRTTTLNQNNEPVQIMVGTLLVPRRSKPD